MKELNSCLVEGKLVADPAHSILPNGTAMCRFLIESRRVVKVDEATEDQVVTVAVITYRHLADVCFEYLKAGRGIRVVSRLAADPSDGSRLVLVAEHVEFKPERRTEPQGQREHTTTGTPAEAPKP